MELFKRSIVGWFLLHRLIPIPAMPTTDSDEPIAGRQVPLGLPGPVAHFEEVKDFCCTFFQWYNSEHHDDGIGLLTRDQVHLGRARGRWDLIDSEDNPYRW